MWYKTLSRCAVVGSLSARARRSVTLGLSACARPKNRAPSASFVFGRGFRENQKGFTLVEMIVAVALFAVVMLVSVGALLSLSGANRKAQALQSVMNNLNIALDGMVRSVRMGSNYHCGGGDITQTQDCQNGAAVFAFEPFGGNPGNPSDQWVYRFDTTGAYCGENRICKSEDGGAHNFAITAPEITVESMKFYVVGTTRRDLDQPKAVMTIKGTAGATDVNARTTFNIQATAVQRLLDL